VPFAVIGEFELDHDVIALVVHGQNPHVGIGELGSRRNPRPLTRGLRFTPRLTVEIASGLMRGTVYLVAGAFRLEQVAVSGVSAACAVLPATAAVESRDLRLQLSNAGAELGDSCGLAGRFAIDVVARLGPTNAALTG
jgi:hypothetical protein